MATGGPHALLSGGILNGGLFNRAVVVLMGLGPSVLGQGICYDGNAICANSQPMLDGTPGRLKRRTRWNGKLRRMHLFHMHVASSCFNSLWRLSFRGPPVQYAPATRMGLQVFPGDGGLYLSILYL